LLPLIPEHIVISSADKKCKNYNNKTIILPLVLFGSETWSLTSREKQRVLRRIFGSKGDEVIGVSRKLHNEELHNLYSLPSIIRMMKSRRMR
jgi:hypothetical protein